MTIGHALALGQARLQYTSSPELDAQVILGHILLRDRAWLASHSELRLSPVAAWRFRWMIARRAAGVPVAYLTHAKEFYGREFYVNEHVLIPRPETEILVERATGTIRANGTIRSVVDVGTGSGCIAITLACEMPRIAVIATDTSRNALKIARQNANRLGTVGRIEFVRGNLLEPIKHELSDDSLVVANLPYLLPSELQGELTYEPRQALYGGSDGLDIYRELFGQLNSLPQGHRPKQILLELHSLTASETARMAKSIFPYAALQTYMDLSSRPRVLALTLA